MGFRINTNISAMNAHRNSVNTNLGLDKSLQRLSSGLRINTAADDASGLAIANSLRSQSTGLGQAIRNANDGIGVTQTADGALDEYENIITTVRTKAIQAASDGQNDASRQAIQNDIDKLLEEADNIAQTTSFNGQNLLDGSFTSKKFHIGAYANETVGVSIDSARTSTIGQFASETGTGNVTAAALTATFTINAVKTGVSTAGSTTNTINALAETSGSANRKAVAMNSVTSSTGVVATADTKVTGGLSVAGGTIAAGTVFINGQDLGDVSFGQNDATGSLTSAINKLTSKSGVTATIVDGGKLELHSADGYNIDVTTTAAGGTVAAAADTAKMFGTGSLVRRNGDPTTVAATIITTVEGGRVTLESDNAITLGTVADQLIAGFAKGLNGQIAIANDIGSVDVTSFDNAELAIKQADHALKQLDAIRSNIGSTQNQLESTVRNISVTQVNVSAAESQIRDVDFAAESASFAKYNILAQSGTYAMSQANAVQQNVLRLLQ